MIGPQRSARGVGGCIDSGKCAELVGKVGLIVKAAIESQLGPCDVLALVQHAHCTLKALYAAPYFGDTPTCSRKICEKRLSRSNLRFGRRR